MSLSVPRLPLTRWQCVVFDLDGTLLDTRGALLRSINAVLATLDRRAVEESEVADAMHEGIESMLVRALSLTGTLPDAAMRERLHVEVGRLYLESAAARVEPFPSLTPLLQLLRSLRVRMAVCTNQLEAHARDLLGQFGLAPFFVEVVGRDTFSIRKPNPLPLVWLLGRCGVHPAHALMVGDSELDAQCAIAAGADVLLMGHGYGGASTASKYASCPDFVALHQLLQSRLGAESIEKTHVSID